MRIIWSSSEPDCKTAYGIVTAEAVRRLTDAGHYVRIATKHQTTGWHYWYDRARMMELVDEVGTAVDAHQDPSTLLGKLYEEVQGIDVFDGTNGYYINKMMEQEKFDYVFTSWDIWTMCGHRLFPKEQWAAVAYIDSEWISERMKEIFVEPGIVIGPTRHAIRELEAMGLRPIYAPLGMDASVFTIRPAGREAFRKAVGLKGGEFLIGAVGLNYGDDRKGYIPLMQAFKVFHERHEEARLYLHSHAGGILAETLNYQQIAKNIGINDWVLWPDQGAMWMGRIDATMMANIYNGFDLFALPTRGEGFGVPIIEAQACGVPVVVTDTTSGPELCKTGWLIKTDKFADREWLGTEGFRLRCDAGAVLDALEEGYAAVKPCDRGAIAQKVRSGILEYDWDNVFPKFWEPLFVDMERKISKA
jgi:glycosyltransferase involved in cell wall biosynthesis